MGRDRTSLPLAEWPEVDRRLWLQAVSKGDFLDPDGRAAHWAEATKTQVAKGYGKFLFFLSRSGVLDLECDLSPDRRIDETRLRAYLALLSEQSLAPVTVFSRITDLTEAIRVMCPEADMTSLRSLCTTLNARAVPKRNKAARVKSPEEIVRSAIGFLARMRRERSGPPSVMESSHHRDALALALLAARPIRRKNFASLVLGENLVQRDGLWSCMIDAERTKEGRELAFTLPDDPSFREAFEEHLRVYRPVLLRRPDAADRFEGPLWISTRGRPMTDHALYFAINRSSERIVGVRINPHLLRDCAASAISAGAPDAILAAARILGHSSLATTLGHYEQSSMLAGLSRLQGRIEELMAEAVAEEHAKDPLAEEFEHDREAWSCEP